MTRSMTRPLVVSATIVFSLCFLIPTAVAKDKAKKDTKIEPHLTYRAIPLARRKSSAHFRESYKDWTDQIYATIKFRRTHDFRHDVVIQPTFRTVRESPEQEEWLFEQAYLESQVKKNLDLTVGKKTEYDGSGFVLNPSDLLNEDKDVYDQLYQGEGVVFHRLKYRLGDHSISFGYIPRRPQAFRKGRLWLTGSADLAEIEVRTQITHNEDEKFTFGLSASHFVTKSLELHWDGRYQQRQRDPTAHRSNDYLAFSGYGKDDSSGFYLFGGRYVFTPRRTLIVEGIQQQSGLLPEDYTSETKTGYFDAKREQQDQGPNSADLPPTRPIGRHYVFATYQDDDSIKATHLAFASLINVKDKSAFSAISVRRHLSRITSVEVAPTYFTGKSDTEFGEMPFSRILYIIFRGRF